MPVGQLSSERPQFESQPLVAERFNRFYRRSQARQDRTEVRNSLLSTSHLPSQQGRTGFSFNFLVQH